MDRFGASRGLSLRNLDPGICVIVGPNEAGKTTVMEFVRAVFFGFRKRSARSNTYEPVDGAPRNGWITLRTSAGTRIRAHRAEKRNLREGHLVITDEGGNETTASSIHLLTAGFDRNAYENLFMFDLEGLRRLDREALRNKILAAALGSVTTSPLDVLTRVSEKLKRTTRCPVREGESLWSLSERLREVDKRIRVLSEKPDRHANLLVSHEAVETRRAHIAAEIERVHEELEQMSRVLGHEDPWCGLVSLDEEIHRLREAKDFPVDGVLRLEQAQDKRTEAQENLWGVEQRLHHFRERLNNLKPDQVLLDHAEEIRTLSREAGILANRPAEIQRARARIVRSEVLLNEEISALGIGWNRDRVDAFDPALVVEQEIGSFCDAWRAYEDRIRGFEQRLGESSERCDRQRAKIQRMRQKLLLLNPRCRGYLGPDSLGRLQEWKSHGKSISDLRDRLSDELGSLEQLIAQRREFESTLEHRRSETGTVVSPVLFWVLMVLVGGAGGGILYSSWLVPGVSSYVLLVAGTCLCLTIPFAIRWKMMWETRLREQARREADALVQKIARVTGEIARLESSRRSLLRQVRDKQQASEIIAAEVLANPGAGLEDVMNAEAASRFAEEPMKLRRQLEAKLLSAEENVQIDEERIREVSLQKQEVERAFDRLKEEWKIFVLDRGFEADTNPETAMMLIVRLGSLKEKARRLAEDEEGLSIMEREWADFSHRVRSLARRMSRQDDVEMSPLDTVEHWMQSENHARKLLAEKDDVLERTRELEVKWGIVHKRIVEAEHQQAALLEVAGVIDEESFRERFRLHEQYNSLDRERRLLISNLLAASGCADEAEMRTRLEQRDWENDKQRAAELRSRHEELRIEAESLANLSGRLSGEIESLEADDEAEKLLEERECLRARLNTLTREWIVLKFSSMMLERTLRIYESDKQPRVLDRASQILREITDGVLTRILFPLDDAHIKAERSDGSRIDERFLSRGTLEQVYLALRLAHLEVYGPEESVPVIMDDALVNFDRSRAGRTVNVLAKFCERTETQVLFFTCHSHVVDLFPEAVSKLVMEPLHGGEGLLRQEDGEGQTMCFL